MINKSLLTKSFKIFDKTNMDDYTNWKYDNWKLQRYIDKSVWFFYNKNLKSIFINDNKNLGES